MKKFKRITAAAAAAAMLFCSTAFAAEENTAYDYFTRLMTYASQLYIDENVSADELIKNALDNALEENPDMLIKLIKAGFSSLDEYTEYYTPEEYVSFINNMNHTFYGIGVVIQKKDRYVEIAACMEDGSAYAAGMQMGDKIIKVDGTDVVDKPLDVVQSMVTGELNTEVNITVQRGDSQLDFKLIRRPVSTNTVSYGIFEGNIGYIDIINFAKDTDAEFEKALGYMEENGVSEIILDLRDNPGGYLAAAVNIAETIVPEGVIVQTMYRDETKSETFYSKLKNPKFRFAVLVNQNTASASEVLSGALQDSGVGYLIGQKTYGKAVIQEMFTLREGAFKITTGHYLTRDGHEINKIGIEPNESVANTEKQVNMANYTPFDYKIKWKVGESGDPVKAAKERLRRMGYYAGELDTSFDEALEKAVNDFQADAGLYPYGVLDISTQVAIENEFYKTQKDVEDNQIKAAYAYFGGNPEIFDE